MVDLTPDPTATYPLPPADQATTAISLIHTHTHYRILDDNGARNHRANVRTPQNKLKGSSRASGKGIFVYEVQ